MRSNILILIVPNKMFAEFTITLFSKLHIPKNLNTFFPGDEMTTPRILGSDDEQDDNTSLSSNDDFSSNNSQVRHANYSYSSYRFNWIFRKIPT